MQPEKTEALLRELCVDLGFCLPIDAYEQLVDAPPSVAEDFARRVFEAEGLDFDTYSRADIRKAVVDKIARYLEPEASPLHHPADGPPPPVGEE